MPDFQISAADQRQTKRKRRLLWAGGGFAGVCALLGMIYLLPSGPSGCGKSTLMAILGLLDDPTSGQYHLAGQDAAHLRERDRAVFRNRHIGFIFQSFNLIGDLTVAENVALPLLYRGGISKPERTAPAMTPASFPAASSSASPSPARWSPSPTSSWPTSPPATSTPMPARR
jgi:hypothetical protein